MALVPEQIVLGLAVAVPATAAGLTVTVAVLDSATAEHDPLMTMALKYFVAVRLPVFSGLEVEEMSDQLVPSVEDCHFVMEPVCPVSPMVVAVPLQIVAAAAAAVPPTAGGSTVTVAVLE